MDEPFPAAGIVPHELTHDLYRHYGALVRLDDIRMDRAKIIEQSTDVVARSLIQQRERIHDLCYENVEKLVTEACPRDVHPDEWELEGLEKAMLERFTSRSTCATCRTTSTSWSTLVWAGREAAGRQREQEFGLYTFLYQIRRVYLREIDEQWIAHLKNIEHLRTGIGLVGYATRNPKNEYKLRGFNLFKDMWEGIENTVLKQILSMRLTAEQKQQAEEGAEYETAVTRANRQAQEPRRRAGSGRAAAGGEQIAKLQDAAREAMQRLLGAQARTQATGQASGLAPGQATGLPNGQASGQASGQPAAQEAPREKQVPRVGKNDPCPCGSGKLYRRCHGKDAAA